MDEKIKLQLLDKLDALVYEIDYDTYEILDGNSAMERQFPNFRCQRCYELLHKTKQPCEKCPMQRVRQGERKISLKKCIDNREEWLQVTFNDFVSEENGKHVCVCTAVDISSIKSSMHMTESVLDGIHAAAYTISPKDYKIQSVNSYLKNLLPDVEVGAVCYEALWDRTSPCSHCPVPHLSKDYMADHMEVYNDKMKLHLSIDSVLIQMPDDEQAVVFTGYDISRQVETENRLKKLAYKDVLLQINNRIAFMEDLTKLYSSGNNGAVCVLRLKNLDNFNLAFGRSNCDQFLVSLGQYYTQVFGEEAVYRIGGARIAFIVNNRAEFALLEQVLQMPVPEEALRNYKNFQFYTDAVVIEIPRYAANPEMLMHNIEYMLEKNGKAESSSVMYFENADKEELERKNKITEILRRKISEKGFQVYYQPIYSIEDQDFTKCEALVRLIDEELGFISPGEFIPIAEERGLINQIGQLVLEKACQFIQSRKEQGLPPVQVNVNVSTIQFSSDGFYERVIETLDRYEIDRRLIHMEVTESILINSFDYIVDIMKRLIDQGILFAVDDFGTGYSSLSYIGTLPVIAIKLDKSFIDNIAQSEVQVLIVKNVIEIAKGLNFKIVAEGVESDRQYQILKKLGCDYIQGYLFSRPLPEDAFSRFLEEKL